MYACIIWLSMLNNKRQKVFMVLGGFLLLMILSGIIYKVTYRTSGSHTITTSVSPTETPAMPDSDGKILYSNSRYGYSVRYLSTWDFSYSQSGGPNEAITKNTAGYISITSKTNDNARIRIDISVSKSRFLDIQDFYNNIGKQTKGSEQLTVYYKRFTTVGSIKAVQYSFMAMGVGKVISTVIIHNNYLYEMILENPVTIPEYTDLISSFKLNQTPE